MEEETKEETAEVIESWVDAEVEEVGPCKKLLKVSVRPSHVLEKFDDAYQELKQGAMVPGFRKGRAPVKLLERKFGDEIKKQVEEDLLGEACQQVLDDNGLNLVGDPEFDKIETAEDKTFTFEATAEVKPEFELGKYKELKLTKLSEKVEEKDVDDSIENIRLQRAELVTEDGRKAREGDVIAGELRISSGENVLSEEKETLIPLRKSRVFGIEIDFASVLKKAKAGDEKSTSVKLPDDFENSEFAGQKADLRVKVKEVKVQKLPEVDDEFAGLMGFENVDAFRQGMSRHVESRKKAAARESLESQIFDNLLSEADFDIPEGMLEKEASQRKDDMRRRLRFRGVPVKVIEERLEELDDTTRDETKNRIKSGFILDAIAEAERVVATEDEVQKLIETLASDYGQKAEDVKKRMEESGGIAGLRTQIRREKTVQLILDKAEIAEGK